tara:strand:- start:1893 stop:2075 length:183 start_codon:yes stop_codon:yes gene_type:complete
MDIKDKIVGLAMVALVSLIGWNLHATWDMKSEIMKLQDGQKILHKKINKLQKVFKKKNRK